MRVAGFALLFALGVAAPLAGVLVALHRIDQARSDGRAELAAAVEILAGRIPADTVPELLACRQRTDHIRAVLEVLISSGIRWPERARLPDPPPGWAPWPRLGRPDVADARWGDPL